MHVQTRVCVMRVQVDLACVLDHVGVIRKRDPETCILFRPLIPYPVRMLVLKIM